MDFGFAPDVRVPDFILAGAMKSGTTSMHHILDAHPRVYIPHEELFFFDVDDFEQHRGFFSRLSDDWVFRDWERDFDRYSRWYTAFFTDARPDQLVGEDSTTYIASRKAPERIARLLPDAKIIVMLRDPVARCYSDYWHRVFRGRLTADFETTLECQPGTLVTRSFYQHGVERFLRHFDRQQLHFVLFEEFIDATQAVVDGVCEFLGVEASIDVDEIKSHRNKAKVPRFTGLQLALNRMTFRRARRYYRNLLPSTEALAKASRSPVWAARDAWNRVVEGGAKLAGRAFARPCYPPMNPGTRAFLTRLFEKENRQLATLVERDLGRWWPTMGADQSSNDRR